MPEDAAMAVVLLLFLSAAVERAVEVVMGAVEGWQAPAQRRLLAVGLSAAAGAAIAFGLELDLVGSLVGKGSLTTEQGRAATAIALAGGSGPAHELIRLLEEAKSRLKTEAPRTN